MKSILDMKILETTLFLPVEDSSHIGEARRRAVSFCQTLDFDETQSGKVGIIATELAGNLLKHAGHGHLLIRALVEYASLGIEIVAMDKGPGMGNLDQCMEDGYSTAGSPGTGLGAIKRLSNHFDVYSKAGKGSIFSCQIFANSLPVKRENYDVGAVSVPYPGERECGDGWAIQERGNHLLVMVADGIGHGPLAAQAAQEAIRIFHEKTDLSPLQLIHAMQGPLTSTRGAAIAIASIDFHRKILHYAGIGNIMGHLLGSSQAAGTQSRGLISYNGTVGHPFPKLQEMTYPWPEGGRLVMHSDGLQSRWKLDEYPGLQQRHPNLTASILYRDFQRGRDDATVLVVSQST